MTENDRTTAYMDEARFELNDMLSRAAHHYRWNQIVEALAEVRTAIGKAQTIMELEACGILSLDAYDSNWLFETHQKANRMNVKLCRILAERD